MDLLIILIIFPDSGFHSLLQRLRCKHFGMFAESEDSLLQFIVRYEVILEYASFLIIVYQTLAAMKGLGLHIVELLAGYPDLNGSTG